MHYHKAIGQKAGISDEQLQELDNYEKSEHFTDLEKAVLAFATQMTRNVRVDAGVLEKLKGQLSPSQLVTLAASVGLANWTNRFNEALSVELP